MRAERASDPAGRRNRGVGLLGTQLGVLVFVLLLLAAVQILYGLYATTMVSAAAQEAARQVAGIDADADRCGSVGAADADLRHALGGYTHASGLQTEWSCSDPDVVAVRVTTTHPSVLPARLSKLLPLGRVDRTFEARAEAIR